MGYYISLSVVSIIISIALFLQIHKKYGKMDFVYFKFLMLSVAVWSVATLMELYAVQEGAKIVISKFSYLGIAPLPVTWFLFSLEYSRKINKLKKYQNLLFWVIPILTMLFVSTNQFHHFHWSNVMFSYEQEGFIFLKYERGPWFMVNSTYSYILLVAGTYIIIRYLFRERIFRDFTLILPAILMPVLSNLLYMGRITTTDYTPIAFSVSVICFAWVILNGFFEKQLIIADRINKNMEEGVLFISDSYEVTSINPHARMILGIPPINGNAQAKDVIPFWEKLFHRLKGDMDELFEVSIGTPVKWYIVHVYSLVQKEKYPGWLIILFDVTGRKHVEEQLIRRDRLMSAMAMASGNFLKNRDYMNAISEGIKIIGIALKADRACLYENRCEEQGENICTQPSFVWQNDKLTCPKEKSFITDDAMPVSEEMLNVLKSGEIVNTAVKEIQENRLRTYLESRGTVSILLLPVIVRGSFWGIIRFENCSQDKMYSENEVSVIQIFSNAVARAVERGMVEVELIAERKKAEAAYIAKGQFLANMSHEIRTPMNGIMGFIELLSQTELDEDQTGYIREVNVASEVLLYLINDILDYSKIEADKVILENIPFNPGALVEDAAMLQAPKAHMKGLEITSMIYSGVPDEVVGDPGRVRQVLSNLISNAVKFTAKGEVTVSLSVDKTGETDYHLRFSVLDTGIGIAGEEMQKLFQPFTQADASTTRKYGGTGLGLAICKKLVTLMGGTIDVNSEEGKGSEFYFVLPMKKTQLQAEIAQKPHRSGLKILAVDDHHTNLTILREYLSREHEVTEIQSWETALERMKTTVFDLALLDYQMPGLNGVMLGKQLKQLTPGVRLIVITSTGQKGEGRNLKELGFDGYLVKPVRKKELLDCIDSVFSDDAEGQKRLITRHTIREDNYLKQSRVLLAEDNEANRRLMLVLLKKIGLEVEMAVNGMKAVQACNTKKYDYILMDCQMPVMDGYEATRIIRLDGNPNTNAPIIAMTANTLEGDREKCIAAGMDDYITKPVTQQKVREVIERMISGIQNQ